MVVPGWAFLLRLINLTLELEDLIVFICLSQAVKEDLWVWQQYLAGFNGRTIFLSEAWYNSNQLKLFTDASGVIGFGAIFVAHWCYGEWFVIFCQLVSRRNFLSQPSTLNGSPEPTTQLDSSSSSSSKNLRPRPGRIAVYDMVSV